VAFASASRRAAAAWPARTRASSSSRASARGFRSASLSPRSAAGGRSDAVLAFFDRFLRFFAFRFFGPSSELSLSLSLLLLSLLLSLSLSLLSLSLLLLPPLLLRLRLLLRRRRRRLARFSSRSWRIFAFFAALQSLTNRRFVS
jgi:hypothetical protein